MLLSTPGFASWYFLAYIFVADTRLAFFRFRTVFADFFSRFLRYAEFAALAFFA